MDNRDELGSQFINNDDLYNWTFQPTGDGDSQDQAFAFFADPTVNLDHLDLATADGAFFPPAMQLGQDDGQIRANTFDFGALDFGGISSMAGGERGNFEIPFTTSPTPLNTSGESAASGSTVHTSPEEAPQDVPMKRKRGRPKGSKTMKRKSDIVPKVVRFNPPLKPSTDRPESQNGPVAPTGGCPTTVGSIATDARDESKPYQDPPAPSQNPQRRGSLQSPAAPVRAPITEEVQQGMQILSKEVLSVTSAFYSHLASIIDRTPVSVLQHSFDSTSREDGILGVLRQAKEVCDGLIAQTTQRRDSLSDGQPQPLKAPSVPCPSFSKLLPAQLQEKLDLQHRGQPMHQLAGAGQRKNSGSAPAPMVHHPLPLPGQFAFGAPPQGDSQASASQHVPRSMPQQQTNHQLPTPLPTPSVQTQSSQKQLPNLPDDAEAQSSTWQIVEIERLRALAMASADSADDHEVNWDWVIDMFGSARSRQQVLTKAVDMGLKTSTPHPPRRRQKTGSTFSSPVTSRSSTPVPGSESSRPFHVHRSSLSISSTS